MIGADDAYEGTPLQNLSTLTITKPPIVIDLVAYKVPVITYQKRMGTDDAYHSYPHWHELHLDIFEQR